jgi:hypothetical protein
MTDLERAQLRLACLEAAKDTLVKGFAKPDPDVNVATAELYSTFVLAPLMPSPLRNPPPTKRG